MASVARNISATTLYLSMDPRFVLDYLPGIHSEF